MLPPACRDRFYAVPTVLLPFLDNAPKIAMETGVKATTKNGLNCWKIGASTGTEPLSEL